ncbi:MAG TPA: hypothetical protein VJ810_31025 [Blastocatellia bacterium]|nr:hypothetical protein [Blastocatellia bacterium]
MGTVIEDAAKASAWIATALSSSGYIADFTAASLWQIDRFFDEQTQAGTAKPGGLLSQDLGSRLFAIGAYIGEVIRRERGGEWVADDNDPQAEINIALRLTDGAICWPVQRTVKRFKNGPEDGIAAYGVGMGLEVGPQLVRAERRPWWRFVSLR